MEHNERRIIVANWKMYLSANEVKNLFKKQHEIVRELSDIKQCRIIICPSSENLFLVHEELKAQNIFLGAQTCSPFSSGAYTGQISARSLSEIGCRYCIIAHSEERARLKESDELIQGQIEQTFNNNLVPIFCIGETIEQFREKKGPAVIKRQLQSLCTALQNIKNKTVYIAYEPIWSIGTGTIAPADYLAMMFEHVQEALAHCAQSHTIKLLYGGSVDGTSAVQFWKIPYLSGLLVGKASTDFQMLKKIVLSSIE